MCMSLDTGCSDLDSGALRVTFAVNDTPIIVSLWPTSLVNIFNNAEVPVISTHTVYCASETTARYRYLL